MATVSKAAVMRVLDAALRAVQTADSPADEQKFKAAVAAARAKIRASGRNGMSATDIAKKEVRRYFPDTDDMFDLAVDVACGGYPISAAMKEVRKL